MGRRRPSAVTNAIRAQWVLVAVSGVATLTAFLMRDDLLRAWAESNSAARDILEQGGLEALLWSFAPEPGPPPRRAADVPTTSPESVAMSKALKRAGFAHVGPTTMYALMEAIGLVDDHLAGCHRRGAAAGSGSAT